MKILRVLLILAYVTPVFAQPTTIGDMSCREWTDEPTKTKGAWVVGYLSGMNVINTLNDKGDILERSPNPDLIMRDIFTRCIKSPEIYLSNVVWSVYMDLMRANRANR